MTHSRWAFAKYTGCGNDFILFDNRKETFPFSPSLIQKLCSRYRGIGADGVLLLENSLKAPFRMRIYNSDGSEAEMCGNGVRCFAHWLKSLHFKDPVFQIETKAGIIQASFVNETVSIQMNLLHPIEWNFPLYFKKQSFLIHILNTGVPHAVLFTSDIQNADLEHIGPFIRNNPTWQPRGINVTLAERVDNKNLLVRTFERGVESETLACGTGATAAALAAFYLYEMSAPISLMTKSKETLLVNFSYENKQFSHITLSGPATCLFTGEIELYQQPALVI